MRKRKSSDSGGELKPEKCCFSDGEAPSCAPETDKDGEGSAAAAAPEERTSREGMGEKKRKVRKSGKGVRSKLDESGVSDESTQVAMAKKSEQGVESKPEKCSVSNGEGPSSAPEADFVMVEKGAEGSAAAAAPEERTSGDGAADDIVKKRKVRRSGKEGGEGGAAVAAAHLDGLQQMAGDNSDADVMRKRKSRKSGKQVTSGLEESGVLTEATEVMTAEKSEEGGKLKLENHSVSNGDAVDGVGGSGEPEEFRTNDVMMAEKGEEGSAIKAAAAPLEEQMFGDGTRAKKKKVRKSGNGVSGKSVESGFSAKAIQVVMADKSEEGAAAAPLDGPEHHARADVVKKKKIRKTVKEVSSVPPQATDALIGEKSEEGTAAALSDGTGHCSSQHAKVRKSGKGMSSVLELVGVPLQDADTVMADKGEEGVGEHLGADVLQKRTVSKRVKAVRTKTELGVSSEASKVVKAKKGEEGAGPSERLQRTVEDHSVVDGVKKTKSGKTEKGISSVSEAVACVSLRVANVAMEGKGEVAAGPLDGSQHFSRDHLIADAGKKSKSWMRGVGASMAGDHTGAEVIPKTKGRKSDKGVSSTHDESGEPILEKSEECAATLSTSSIVNSSMDLELLPNSPIDASDKNLSKLPVGSRDGVLRQASDSLLSEDPSLALTKTPDRNSPIRGVVVQHDLASADLLDGQNNQLEPLIAEEASFSFQLSSGVTPVNGFTKKKLLVLDLNGILTDIVTGYCFLLHKEHKRIQGKTVYKRPFCDDFLRFCFERFDIGIWSSRKMCNVTAVVDYLMADTKHKLLFSWDLSRCTGTRCKIMENSHKPLVLKELKRLWNKEDPDLPWEKGEYSSSNTLLVDDSPCKALCNPVQEETSVFISKELLELMTSSNMYRRIHLARRL